MVSPQCHWPGLANLLRVSTRGPLSATQSKGPRAQCHLESSQGRSRLLEGDQWHSFVKLVSFYTVRSDRMLTVLINLPHRLMTCPGSLPRTATVLFC